MSAPLIVGEAPNRRGQGRRANTTLTGGRLAGMGARNFPRTNILKEWHSKDENDKRNVFTSESKLKIDAGTHKDVNWAGDGFNVLEIAENEHLSVKITQVGSTLPGEDLVVQMLMREKS